MDGVKLVENISTRLDAVCYFISALNFTVNEMEGRLSTCRRGAGQARWERLKEENWMSFAVGGGAFMT